MLVLAVGGTACTSGGGPSPSTDAVELTVFAAASLRDVLERAKSAFESVATGTTLTLATDSSTALRTQIEQGAPADVFLSADTGNPEALVDAGLTDGAAIAFAANLLTIVVPEGNPAAIESPVDLARSGLKVIAAGDEVPISRYAAEALEKLARLPGYPSGFATAYAANVVSREDNVKAVVTKIELGEGDAGIVYVTDARASSGVETIDIPGEANVPAVYAGVVVARTPHRQAARAFLDWLTGPGGQSILAEAGFQPPP
jgi:molybdate transport system substrate-binding protein